MIINKEVTSLGSVLEYEIGIRGTDYPGEGAIPVGNLAFFLGGVSGVPNDHSGWADGGGAIPLNSWTHLALAFDGSLLVVYINAQETRQASLAGSISMTTAPLKIGSRSDPVVTNLPRERFTGLIDEVTVHDRALTQAEVQAIHDAGSAGKCPAVGSEPPCATGIANIVSWWPGEDDALDIVGSNHGVPLNGTSFMNGLVNRAFSFDGLDDHVDIAHADGIFFSNTEPFTVEAWFRPILETPSYFILKNAAYGMRWQGSSNPLLFYNGTDHFSVKSDWHLGRWYHVAVVDDGNSSVKLYIDGILDKSDDGSLRNPNRLGVDPLFTI